MGICLKYLNNISTPNQMGQTYLEGLTDTRDSQFQVPVDNMKTVLLCYPQFALICSRVFDPLI